MPFESTNEKERRYWKSEVGDSLRRRSSEFDVALENLTVDDLEHELDGILGYSNVGIRYIAPFDDNRIVLFSRNWYSQREASATRASESAGNLVRAIHGDSAILSLARIPNFVDYDGIDP